MKNTIIPLYKCTMAALYSVCRTLWENYTARIAGFTAYKASYTAAVATAAQQKIDDAEALPGEAQRNEVAAQDRIVLVTLSETCTGNFVKLRGYINGKWKDNATRHLMYRSAGEDDYNLAVNENWEHCTEMNVAMKNFMAAHLADLTANNNMPAGFPGDVDADALAFETQYNLFKSDSETADETAAKIKANNEIYTEAIEMCADGLIVFVNDDTVAEEFTFSRVLEIVAPPGSSSLTITTKDKMTHEILPNVPVTIHQDNGVELQGVSNDAGEVLFNRIDPGTWFWKAGLPPEHPTITGTKEVETGVNARLTVEI